MAISTETKGITVDLNITILKEGRYMAVDHFAVNTAADIFADDDPIDAKFNKLRDYLYQICESLHYTLHNLGSVNFTDDEYELVRNPDTTDITNRLTALETAVGDLQTAVSNLSGLPDTVSSLVSNVSSLIISVNTLNSLIRLNTDTYGNTSLIIGNSSYPTMIYGNPVSANNNIIG